MSELLICGRCGCPTSEAFPCACPPRPVQVFTTYGTGDSLPDALASKDRQIAELTRRAEVAEARVATRNEWCRTATARAERAEKAVEACKPLIDACREEFMGDEGLCDHEPDNEPVMAGLDKKSPITFGMVRAALAAAGTRGEGEKP